MPVFPSGKLQRPDAKTHRVPSVQGGELFQYQLDEMGLVRCGDCGGQLAYG
jgi:hypothetical protein